jgi:molecular chaperone GrpE
MTIKKEKNKEAEVKEKIEMPEEVMEVIEDEIGTVSKEEEYLDGWKRCQADFENYKKRQADSQKDLLRYSTQNIILQILPVIDNFHASTDHIPEDQKENSWVTGIMYIQKQLEQVLTDNGVTEIEIKVGDSFDPAMHEAVADMECKGCKTKDYKFNNKIKKVVTRGYQMGDKVVRASRVIVE